MAAPWEIRPNEPIVTTNITIIGGDVNAWEAIDDDPDTPDLNNYIYDAGTSNGELVIGMTDTPADFSSMTSPMTVRALTQSVGFSDDSDTLSVEVQDASGTALTNQVTLSTQADTAQAIRTANLTVNSTGLAASKATWDNARLRLLWTYSQNMGKDDGSIRVYALELNSTYDEIPAPSAAPTLSMTGNTATSISLSTTTVSGAITYEFQRDGVTIQNTSSTTVTDSGLSAGTSYNYRVRGVNGSGPGPWSTVQTFSTVGPPTAAPTISTTGQTASSISLTATTIDNAATYEFQRDGATIQNTSANTVTDIGLSPSTSYTYRVRGVSSGGAGPWSSELAVSTLEQSTYTDFSNYTAGITPSDWREPWTVASSPWVIQLDSERAGGQVLHRPSASSARNSIVWDGLGQTADTDIICLTEWPPISAGSTADWVGIAARISGSAGAETGVMAFIDNETDLSIRQYNAGSLAAISSVTVPFTPVVGGWYYIRFKLEGQDVYAKIWEETSDEPAEWLISALATVTSTGYSGMFVYTGSNDIRVDSFGLYALEAPSSAPAISSPEQTDTTIELAWSSVSGAANYEIERDAVTIKTVTDTVYTDTNLTAETSYNYRVRATNATGVGPWSDSFTVFTTAEPPLAPVLALPVDGSTFHPDSGTFTWDFIPSNSDPNDVQTEFAFKRVDDSGGTRDFTTSSYAPTALNTGYDVSFSPDGSLLAIGVYDSIPGFMVFDTSDWSVVSGTPSVDGYARSVDFSPDGQFLAVGTTTSPFLYILNTSDWSTVSGTPILDGSSWGVKFSPDGAYLAVSCTTTSYVLNTSDWSPITIPSVPGTGYSLDWSYDGSYVVFGSNTDPKITLVDSSDWSLVSGLPTPPGVIYDLTFSPDGSTLFVSFFADPYMWLLNTSDWSEVAEFTSLMNLSYESAYTQDGKYLAIAMYSTSDPYFSVIDTENYSVVPNVPSIPSTGRGIAFSPDESILAIAHHNSPNLTIVDVTRTTAEFWWNGTSWQDSEVFIASGDEFYQFPQGAWDQ